MILEIKFPSLNFEECLHMTTAGCTVKCGQELGGKKAY
jgi:hypothetical protein